jgi:hypothetical protein
MTPKMVVQVVQAFCSNRRDLGYIAVGYNATYLPWSRHLVQAFWTRVMLRSTVAPKQLYPVQVVQAFPHL